MKNKAVILAAAYLLISVFGIKAYAFDDPSVLEYSSDGDKITAYVSGIESENVSCRIAGVDYPAERKGIMYSDSEEYRTLFLIDPSQSMAAYKDSISTFLLDCIDKKQDNEYYSIAVFGSKNTPDYLIDFDNDRYALEKTIDNISYDFQSSYIFSNLHNAINELTSEDKSIYKRIVLFTDGGENSAKGMTVDEVISDLSKTPIQVYTVTFVNSAADNYEQLKTIARIARSSGGSDIMISKNTVTAQNSEILFTDAAEISQIEIQLDNTAADGSVKAVEITSGQTVVKADLRMPMLSSAAVITEAAKQTEDAESQGNEEVTTLPAETENQYDEETKSADIIIPIAIAVAVIALLVIVITVILSRRKNNISVPSDTPVFTADNDDTMIISSRSGDTEMLFEDSAGSVIILRDVMNTDHTYEASLSSDIIVGRSSEVSSLIVDYDKSVSKRHCKIYLKGNDVYIEDLGSANKTYVNDVQISSPHIIRNADEIKIGRVKFSVTIK